MAQAKKKAKKKAAAKAKPMKSFLVTYHSGAAAGKKMAKATPDEMNAMMQSWMDWAQSCGEHLTEMGSPLHSSVNFKAKGKPSPSGRRITGYSKLNAPTMAAAKKLVQNHPHLKWASGCEVELHEMSPMG